VAALDDEIGRLDGLPMFELRTLWRRLWKQPPPMRLSRDMLIRGLAWKLHEGVLGGIGKADLRKLAALAKCASDERQARNGDIDADDNCAIDKHTSVDGGINATNIIRRTPNPSAPAITLREGNRLVREWNGTTHTVLVLASGFEWQGRQYRSLSQIAEAITGAHWSGPRFFGLTNRKGQGKGAGGKVASDKVAVAKAAMSNVATGTASSKSAIADLGVVTRSKPSTNSFEQGVS
jgi:Protein of unknown function (DUF2924)